MQPFTLDQDVLICNGEIYNFRSKKEELIRIGYEFRSESDCEILLPLYHEYGLALFGMLDAEFALVLYDHEKKSFVAARDPIGIRPLYYGIDSSGYTLFASEPKNLVGLCDMILPFPPGHYYVDGKFVSYLDPSKVERVSYDSSELVSKMIHDRLVEGVRKRLDAQLRKACPLPGLRGVTERVPFGDDREPVVVHGEREGFELLFPYKQHSTSK